MNVSFCSMSGEALNAIEFPPWTGVEFSFLKSDTQTSVKLQLQQLGNALCAVICALSRVSQGFISPLEVGRLCLEYKCKCCLRGLSTGYKRHQDKKLVCKLARFCFQLCNLHWIGLFQPELCHFRILLHWPTQPNLQGESLWGLTTRSQLAHADPSWICLLVDYYPIIACCPKMWRGRVTCAPSDERNASVDTTLWVLRSNMGKKPFLETMLPMTTSLEDNNSHPLWLQPKLRLGAVA